jgi:hypothetical protein
MVVEKAYAAPRRIILLHLSREEARPGGGLASSGLGLKPPTGGPMTHRPSDYFDSDDLSELVELIAWQSALSDLLEGREQFASASWVNDVCHDLAQRVLEIERYLALG